MTSRFQNWARSRREWKRYLGREAFWKCQNIPTLILANSYLSYGQPQDSEISGGTLGYLKIITLQFLLGKESELEVARL